MNQIGSVTESIEAVRMSKQAGWGVMASHRRYLFCFVTLYYSLYVHTNVIHLVYCSGETEDTFIADLSVGLATVSCQNPKLFFFSIISCSFSLFQWCILGQILFKF